MGRVFEFERLRYEVPTRGVIRAGRTLELNLEPFSRRSVFFKNLDIEIDAVVVLDLVYGPSVWFGLENAAHLGFAQRICYMARWSLHSVPLIARCWVLLPRGKVANNHLENCLGCLRLGVMNDVVSKRLFARVNKVSEITNTVA